MIMRIPISNIHLGQWDGRGKNSHADHANNGYGLLLKEARAHPETSDSFTTSHYTLPSGRVGDPQGQGKPRLRTRQR